MEILHRHEVHSELISLDFTSNKFILFSLQNKDNLCQGRVANVAAFERSALKCPFPPHRPPSVPPALWSPQNVFGSTYNGNMEVVELIFWTGIRVSIMKTVFNVHNTNLVVLRTGVWVGIMTMLIGSVGLII